MNKLQNTKSDFGKCCSCGERTAANVLLINRQSPEKNGSTGWGCLICNLPKMGVITAKCDDCLKVAEIDTVIVGDPKANIRVPFREVLNWPYHLHDLRLHVGNNEVGSKDLQVFNDSPDAGHFQCACSLCGQLIPENEVPVRISISKDSEIRLHRQCLRFMIYVGIKI